MVQLQRVLHVGLPSQVRELGVLLLHYMIILAIISGSCATNTTVVPATSLLLSTNNSQVDVTPPPLETREIEEVITKVTEIYTEIPVENAAAEVFDQLMTTQLSETDVYQTTQITSLSTTLVDVVDEAQTTVSSLPTEIHSTQRPTISPTPVIPQRTDSPTTAAQISSPTPENSKQITTNPIITSQAATSISSITSKATTPTLTPNKASISMHLTTNNSTTLTAITSRAASPSLATNLTSTSSSYATGKRTTPSFGTTSRASTSSPSISSNATTVLNTVPKTIASTSPYKQSTELNHLSRSSSANPKSTRSTYSTSTESSSISKSTENNRTKTVSYSTTIYEHVKTSDIGEPVSSTKVSLEDTSLTTFIYVDDDTDLADKDELPFLLIIIACTVTVLVTLLILLFVGIVCFTRKRQERRNAKYYDYKKRWVKKAPRPKYEKVKQNFRHDREAAGSGWVFQDGADPSKQITLELRPRNSQSSPEASSNKRNSNPLNFETALSETYPHDMLSSPEVAVDLDGGSIGSLGLSKSFDRVDRSTSSEGDSGILALGEDAWSPTKGVPFHFISDDAVIEL